MEPVHRFFTPWALRSSSERARLLGVRHRLRHGRQPREAGGWLKDIAAVNAWSRHSPGATPSASWDGRQLRRLHHADGDDPAADAVACPHRPVRYGRPTHVHPVEQCGESQRVGGEYATSRTTPHFSRSSGRCAMSTRSSGRWFVYAGAERSAGARSEGDAIVKALRTPRVPVEYMVAGNEGKHRHRREKRSS